MKKNTLLYMDEELVSKAKELDFNISRIAEDAIKTRLFPQLSSQEFMKFDIWKYLKKLRKEKRAYFLPAKIKHLDLSNVGPFKEKSFNFEDFNIIVGGNASGKTFLIRSIAQVFEKEERFEMNLEEDFSIKLEVESKKMHKISKTEDNIDCVLIDSPLVGIGKEHFAIFLKKLEKLGKQIILTRIPSKEKYKKKHNLIEI